MKKALTLACVVLLGASGGALAQYTGPGPGQSALKKAITPNRTVVPMTVGTLTASGKDDAWISLQGRIVRHTGGDKYRFADSTGEIDVEIEAEHWPANTPIDDKAEVRITGEYDKSLLTKPKVEVDRIEKLK